MYLNSHPPLYLHMYHSFFPFGTIREISALEWFLRFLKYLIITSNFAFCNCSYLGFHFLKEDRATLELLSILNSTIIIPKLHIKVAVRAIFRKIYNLRNLTFNNFMTNLGFLPLQEDLEILQQFIVPWYHWYNKAFLKACGQTPPWSDLSWKKLVIFEILHFRYFNRNLVSSPG